MLLNQKNKRILVAIITFRINNHCHTIKSKKSISSEYKLMVAILF